MKGVTAFFWGKIRLDRVIEVRGFRVVESLGNFTSSLVEFMFFDKASFGDDVGVVEAYSGFNGVWEFEVLEISTLEGFGIFCRFTEPAEENEGPVTREAEDKFAGFE